MNRKELELLYGKGLETGSLPRGGGRGPQRAIRDFRTAPPRGGAAKRAAVEEEAPNERAKIGGNQPPPEAKVPIERGSKPKASSNFTLPRETRSTPKGNRVRKDPAMYHPVGEGVKLERPLSEMSATYEPTGEMVPRKPITAEDFKPGDVVMPFPGDRTIAGHNLTGINETKFENPVKLQGGPNFMRMLQNLADNAGWASGQSVITTLLNRARDSANKTGGRVFGMYAPMSHGGSDFATMTTEAIREMMKKANVSQADAAAFDEAMRARFGEGKTGFKETPDFPGILSMDDAWIAGAGKGRAKLAKILNKSEWRNKGFPDMGSVRHALTEPDLLHTPSMEAGYNVVEIDPSRSAVTALTDPHGTYPHGLPVKGYFGSMDKGIPVQEGWPDWMKSRPEGEKTSNRDYTFRMVTPPQEVTQQLIDSLMTRRGPQ